MAILDEETSFTNMSSLGAATVKWDFGDGTTIQTDINAKHTYKKVGTYTATLTITTGADCYSVKTAAIQVIMATPTLSIPPVCEGNDLLLTTTAKADITC